MVTRDVLSSLCRRLHCSGYPNAAYPKKGRPFPWDHSSTINVAWVEFPKSPVCWSHLLLAIVLFPQKQTFQRITNFQNFFKYLSVNWVNKYRTISNLKRKICNSIICLRTEMLWSRNPFLQVCQAHTYRFYLMDLAPINWTLSPEDLSASTLVIWCPRSVKMV